MPQIDEWDLRIRKSDGVPVHCGQPMSDDIEFASCHCGAYASTSEINAFRQRYGFTERWPAGSSAIGEHMQRY